MNCRYFPNSWKTAKVLPIIKKGKPPHDIASYRPISLTPAISKVFDAIIHNAITKHTTNNKIIPETQFGFKHRHSSIHEVHKITNDIITHVYNNRTVEACPIYIEKAFDSVWINGIIYTLNELNFPTDLIEIIWRMITNRRLITWNGEQVSSITYYIKEGLALGTVINPILDNIFTHSITNLFQLNSNNNSHSATYADDLIILADIHPNIVQDKLETLVNKLNQHYLNWNLKINPSKCETILFHKPLRFLNRSRRFHINIAIQNSNSSFTIQHTKSVRCLGVQIDYLLKFNIHVNTQIQKVTNLFRKYNRIIFHKSLSQRAKIICYLLLIRPIITYAAPIWWNMNAARRERIRKFERNCLRAALHIYRKIDSTHFINNKTLYNLADIPRIDNHILKLTRDYSPISITLKIKS